MSKLNWVLRSIRSVSEGVIRDFLEIVLSGIIRDISQQDPNDLRIRKRKKLIYDADVFELYLNALGRSTNASNVSGQYAVILQAGSGPVRLLKATRDKGLHTIVLA